jgi:hypothetical protein
MEFQHPEVGDVIELGSKRMRLEQVEPRHALAWRSEDGNWVWTFVLVNRGIAMLPMEPASLVMERRMLREIKRLSES